MQAYRSASERIAAQIFESDSMDVALICEILFLGGMWIKLARMKFWVELARIVVQLKPRDCLRDEGYHNALAPVATYHGATRYWWLHGGSLAAPLVAPSKLVAPLNTIEVSRTHHVVPVQEA